MRASDRQALWQTLQHEGMVGGDCPVLMEAESPWYVRAMLGVAGWIGSLFLLGFVGVGFTFVMKSAVASLVVGAVVCGAAFALFKSSRGRDFITQFGLAISLAGQMLLVYGLAELFERHDALLYGSVSLIELLLTLVMPNFICRVTTSSVAAVAFAFALNSAGFYGFAPGVTAAGFALIWMLDVHWGRSSAVCRPFGYGLALSLLLYQSGMLWGRELWWPRSSEGANWLASHAPWLGKALVVAVVLVVVAVLLKRLKIVATSRAGTIALGGASLVMAVSFPAPGIAAALLILIVGFANCNRILFGLGLAAFAGFLSNYYYTLGSTLLEKSMLLIALGAILLVARLLLRAWLPAAGPEGRNDA